MKNSAKLFLPIICLMLYASAAFSQNAATKKIINKYAADYIPEFKSSLAYRSNNPELAKIDVVIDFNSFGDDAGDLDLAVRQLNMVKGAILFLAKDAARKAAIENGLKTVTVRKGTKQISLKDGNLLLAAENFDLNKVIGTPEIQKFLESKL